MYTGREVKKLTIQPPLLSEEPNLALGVAPDQRDDDGLLFAALEPVHTAELDARELVFERGENRKLNPQKRGRSQHIHLISCLRPFVPAAPSAVPLRMNPPL